MNSEIFNNGGLTIDLASIKNVHRLLNADQTSENILRIEHKARVETYFHPELKEYVPHQVNEVTEKICLNGNVCYALYNELIDGAKCKKKKKFRYDSLVLI